MKFPKAIKIAVFSVCLCLIAALSYGASQQTSSTTGAQIITRARYYLNDKLPSASSAWTDAELLVWINDGVVDIASRTRCTETKETITLAANTIEYSITTNYIAVTAAVYSPASGFKSGLLRGHPIHIGHGQEYNKATKSPKYWYDWRGDVGIYPPLASVTSEIVELYSVSRPDDLTATTSTVTVPAIYDRALTFYVTAQAFMKTEQWSRSAQFITMYYEELNRFRQDFVNPPREPETLWH